MTPASPPAETTAAAPAETRAAALAALRELVGRDDAEFHDGQFEAIEALVDGRRRALVVQRTGWGKSAVYFVATLLLRRRGAGPTVLVSPLLALMRDQIAAAERAGVRAVAINSTNPHEWADVLRRLDADEVDVLLVSPERLNNPSFREQQLPALVRRIGTARRRRGALHQRLGPRLPSRLPPPPRPHRADAGRRAGARHHRHGEQPGGGGCRRAARRHRGAHDPRAARPRVAAARRAAPARLASTRLAWLLSHLDDLPGSGIIYTLTVASAVGHRAAAARARARRARLHGPDRPRRARGVRGAAEAQRG